ncbi:E3 ubiquitin-protein ligase RFI2-like [Eucalyptus grandis]|uniref:E3 ubiquitin-protein ligase RFI2-like n=1 Tax=Eucalyptus grandis TaxID=71139 RepID=UPI00192EBFAA|nr:E3 ubiquitin-protein ligase RFI2-like [Eucalyptus grandis]
MGLKGSAGDDDLAVDDGEGGGRSVPCSICLEVVTDNGDRAWAKLQCGHQFHLDCIGSAFNCKGAMQCPNCRKTEKGQWLYATGCRSLPEFSLDEWAHEEDLYDLSYSEMVGCRPIISTFRIELSPTPPCIVALKTEMFGTFIFKDAQATESRC